MAQARRDLERVGRLSDDLVRLGPFRFGWDALLEFVPVVGEVYSVGAGAWLLVAGRRAHAPPGSLAAAAALVGARTAVGAFDLVPVVGLVGDLVAGLFRGHRRAAQLLIAVIDRTWYVEGPRTSATERTAEAARSAAGKRRVVFLG